MNFQQLHESLRLELVRRIRAGYLTGIGIARQTGFQQAHISNFLRGRRCLSLEGLDRVLNSQGLSVEDLLPINLSASVPQSSPGTEAFENVPLVSPATLIQRPHISPSDVLGLVPVNSYRLPRTRVPSSPGRSAWQRFAAIRTDLEQVGGMEPLLQPGAVAVLDRHDVSLAAQPPRPNLVFAVHYGVSMLLRFVDSEDGCLIFRALSPGFSVRLVRLGFHESPADYIIGRVCLLLMEL